MTFYIYKNYEEPWFTKIAEKWFHLTIILLEHCPKSQQRSYWQSVLLSSRVNLCFNARSSMNMLRLALFTMFKYLIQKLVTCVSRPKEWLNYIFLNEYYGSFPPPPHLKKGFASPHELSYLCLKMASICFKIFIKPQLKGVFREIKRIFLYIYNYAYSYSFHCRRYSLLLIKIFWVAARHLTRFT